MSEANWWTAEFDRMREVGRRLAGPMVAHAPLGPERLTGALRKAGSTWTKLSLVRRFILISSAVVLLGMTTIGLWVAKKIEQGVTRYSAATAVAYMDGLIAPLAQDLAAGDSISPENARKVAELIGVQSQADPQIVAVKLWKRDGVVAYSTWPELIGKKFAPTPSFERAWSGDVSAVYDQGGHGEEEGERNQGMRLLEVYAPIREIGTDRIIAVAEFYLSADALNAELRGAIAQSWLVVGATTVAIVLALFGLVLGASSTIERQRLKMQQQIASLEDLVRQNRELRERVEGAFFRTTDINERFLRRLGSDLHDGPAQLLGLALLRLDSLFRRQGNEAKGEAAGGKPAELRIVRNALQDALREIRNLSSGFALPELDRMNLKGVIDLVARNHEKRTGTKVALDYDGEDPPLSKPAKECIYRFLQEALNNSFRHADGKGQRIHVRMDRQRLVVRAVDAGPGINKNKHSAFGSGLGLIGLRDRVESLGGELTIESEVDHGTLLTASFDPIRIRGS